MTAGRGIYSQEMPKGDHADGMHGFSCGRTAVVSKDDRAAVSRGEKRWIFRRSRTMTAHTCAWYAGISGERATGGRHRCRSHLSGCVRAAGKEEDVAGGNHTACVSPTFLPGNGKFCNASEPLAVPTERWAGQTPSLPLRRTTVHWCCLNRGDELMVEAGDDEYGFCWCRASPRGAVAWYGPIVMNTQEQLRQAFNELEKGTFLKQLARG